MIKKSRYEQTIESYEAIIAAQEAELKSLKEKELKRKEFAEMAEEFGIGAERFRAGYQKGFAEGHFKGLCDSGRGVIDGKLINLKIAQAQIEKLELLKRLIPEFYPAAETNSFADGFVQGYTTASDDLKKEIDKLIKELKKEN